MNHPSTVTELMAEAANALIRRDPYRLEELERISRGWMQTADEELAQIILLQAMIEAADLLLDTPSEIKHA
ncbi:hypothetical protein A6J80_10695 [Paracoccus yeei]|uniref:Uncharacterized protein n=1 Tax=Paracoccus yeei TaxID=147645 RepID=A0A1V0GSW8_9RHOB|nr:hypothetical protein [Paracoccus yeei]ARC36789.1 hypothetical protein A6J80_10695 [Paracoccus yeei]